MVMNQRPQAIGAKAKVLSVRQPWAEHRRHEGDREPRVDYPPRGRLLIHAARIRDDETIAQFNLDPRRAPLWRGDRAGGPNRRCTIPSVAILFRTLRLGA